MYAAEVLGVVDLDDLSLLLFLSSLAILDRLTGPSTGVEFRLGVRLRGVDLGLLARSRYDGAGVMTF